MPPSPSQPPICMPPPPSQPSPPAPSPSDYLGMFTAEDIAQMDEDVQKAVYRIIAEAQAFHDRKKGIIHTLPTDPESEIAMRFQEDIEKGLWPLSEEERQRFKQSEEDYAADMKEWEDMYEAFLNQECDEDECDLECSGSETDRVKRQRLMAPLPDVAR